MPLTFNAGGSISLDGTTTIRAAAVGIGFAGGGKTGNRRDLLDRFHRHFGDLDHRRRRGRDRRPFGRHGLGRQRAGDRCRRHPWGPGHHRRFHRPHRGCKRQRGRGHPGGGRRRRRDPSRPSGAVRQRHAGRGRQPDDRDARRARSKGDGLSWPMCRARSPSTASTSPTTAAPDLPSTTPRSARANSRWPTGAAASTPRTGAAVVLDPLTVDMTFASLSSTSSPTSGVDAGRRLGQLRRHRHDDVHGSAGRRALRDRQPGDNRVRRHDDRPRPERETASTSRAPTARSAFGAVAITGIGAGQTGLDLSGQPRRLHGRLARHRRHRRRHLDRHRPLRHPGRLAHRHRQWRHDPRTSAPASSSAHTGPAAASADDDFTFGGGSISRHDGLARHARALGGHGKLRLRQHDLHRAAAFRRRQRALRRLIGDRLGRRIVRRQPGEHRHGGCDDGSGGSLRPRQRRFADRRHDGLHPVGRPDARLLRQRPDIRDQRRAGERHRRSTSSAAMRSPTRPATVRQRWHGRVRATR